MSKCAYSLDGTSWTDFPVGPQFDLQISTEESNIMLETDSGYKRIYRQFKRQVWTLSFKVQQSSLSVFSDFHRAVRGAITPFYLTLDRTADPIVAIYGKKLQSQTFEGTGERVLPPVLVYQLTIRQEL